MNKLILLLAISILSFVQLHSEDFWEKINLPQGDTLGGLLMDREDNLYIGSKHSGILFSSDYGKSWQTNFYGKDGVKLKFYPYACDSSNNIYSVSGDKIYVSDRSNNTWIELGNNFNLGDTVIINNIQCDSKGNLIAYAYRGKFANGYIIPDTGKIFMSEDKGTSWKRIGQPIDSNGFYNYLTFDFENNLYITSNYHYLNVSTNYGKNWSSPTRYKSPSNLGKIIVTDQKIYLNGNDMHVLNKGDTISKAILKLGSYHPITNSFLSKANVLYAFVLDSGLLVSSDSGLSWSTKDTSKIGLIPINIVETSNNMMLIQNYFGYFKSKIGLSQMIVLCNISPITNDTAKFYPGDTVTYNFEILDSTTNKPLENTKLYLSDNLLNSKQLILTDIEGKASYSIIVPQGTPIGDYQLKLYYFKSGYDKKDTITKTFHIDKKINSVDFNISDKFLNVNPNPVINTSIISYTLPQQSEFSLFLTDINGNKYILLHDIKSAGEYKINLDTKNLTSGTYFISLELSEQKYIRKVEVVK